MTKTLYVEPTHFLFWPCQCGDVYGRHYGSLSDWPDAGHCYDCKCQKFTPAQPFEDWQKSVREELARRDRELQETLARIRKENEEAGFK